LFSQANPCCHTRTHKKQHRERRRRIEEEPKGVHIGENTDSKTCSETRQRREEEEEEERKNLRGSDWREQTQRHAQNKGLAACSPQAAIRPRTAHLAY
jgi:hypothetical protein